MITFAFLAVLLIAVILLSLGIGATKISAAEIMGILTKRVGLSSNVGFTERQEAILMSIRLPRIIMGCLVGIALAVSGAALQGLFRNPLADPTLIGVSGGAMVGVVSFIVLGDRFISEIPEGFWKNLTLPLAGFLGGVTATSIAYRISTINKHTEITSMLLAGIAIGTLAGAIVGVFFYVSDDSQIRSITFWMLGSVAGATWNSIVSIFPFIAATAFILPSLGKHLNALLLGENVAFHIGAHVQKSKQIIILLTCLGIGAAVCVSGIIGLYWFGCSSSNPARDRSKSPISSACFGASWGSSAGSF